MKLLMSAWVPDNTKVALPEPEIVTPPPLAAVKVPTGTLKVTVMVPEATSTSLTLMPVMAVGTSSTTAIEPATLTGASLTAVTVVLTVAVSSAPPDVTV